MRIVTIFFIFLATVTIGNSQSADTFARISFDNNTYNADTMMEGDTISVRYHFINTGNIPLRIKQVWPGCGCTVPSYPKEAVMPGQDGFMELTFYSRTHPGTADKYAIILSNAVEEHLFIKGYVVDKDLITRPARYSQVIAEASLDQR